MNGQESRRLIIEKQILAKQCPQSDRLCGGSLLGIVGIVAKRLNVTGHFPFDRERAFEWTSRRHPAVLIDRVDTFAHAKRRPRRRPRAEVIVGDGKGPIELLEARLIFSSVRREAERPIRNRVPESEAAGGRAGEVFDAHANFTFRCQKPKDGLGVLFGLSRLRSETETEKREQERTTAGSMRERSSCGKCCHHFLHQAL